MDAGPTNWQKACFVPTKSDALVVGFRKWLNKYAGGQVDWRGRYSGADGQVIQTTTNVDLSSNLIPVFDYGKWYLFFSS